MLVKIPGVLVGKLEGPVTGILADADDQRIELLVADARQLSRHGRTTHANDRRFRFGVPVGGIKADFAVAGRNADLDFVTLATYSTQRVFGERLLKLVVDANLDFSDGRIRRTAQAEADRHTALGRLDEAVGLQLDDRRQDLRHGCTAPLPAHHTRPWRRARSGRRTPRGGGERLAPLGLRQADGLDFVADPQRLAQDVRPVEAITEAADGKEVGSLVVSPVQVPADQILAAGRGVVITRRCPQNPALAVGVREQGHFFAPVLHAEPADGAIAERGDCPTTVVAHIDRPYGARCPLLPEGGPVPVEGAQEPFASQHESAPIGAHGDAVRDIAGAQGQGECTKFRIRRISPVAQGEMGLLGQSRRREFRGRRMRPQLGA